MLTRTNCGLRRRTSDPFTDVASGSSLALKLRLSWREELGVYEHAVAIQGLNATRRATLSRHTDCPCDANHQWPQAKSRAASRRGTRHLCASLMNEGAEESSV